MTGIKPTPPEFWGKTPEEQEANRELTRFRAESRDQRIFSEMEGLSQDQWQALGKDHQERVANFLKSQQKRVRTAIVVGAPLLGEQRLPWTERRN